MKKIVYPSSSIYLDANFLALFDCVDDLQKEEGFYLIDQNVYRMHQDVFFGFKKIIIIPSGEGGVCTTNSPDLANVLCRFRSHGITRQQNEMTKKSDGPWYYQQ